MLPHSKFRFNIIVTLFVLFLIGLGSKVYTGFGQVWINHYLGGIIYVMFFILLMAAINPDLSLRKVTIWVVVVTCALETLQLWQPQPLKNVRSYFIGRALLGTTFDWQDFPHYIVGGVAGFFLWRIIIKQSNRI